MTPLEAGAIFLLGLASGLHCLQMFGPIVLAYSVSLVRGGAGRETLWRAHAAYNAGRILTYCALGAVAGSVGRAIGLLGRIAGMSSGARVVGGAAMLVTGILMIGLMPAGGLVRIRRGGRLAGVGQAIGRWLASSGTRGKFALGLTLGFLPCGLVYAALGKAMESGAALTGALTMLAFGAGTAVALAAMGVVSSVAGYRLGRWSTRLAAVAVMLFGAILLWRGLAGKPVCHG
jgi:hypothetical protein